MGLGKTVITLTALSDLIDAYIIKRALVIAPLRVANTVWKQEAAKWEHLNHLAINVCTGTAEQRTAALKLPADVYVINRENVPWLVDLCGKKWPYGAIVFEEVSSFKNHSALRFKKIKKPSQLSQVVILLTGTPAPNGLIDLWSQAYLMDGGELLGTTFTGYKNRFFESDYMGYNLRLREGSSKVIHDLLKNRILSMTAEDYLLLPERIDLVEKVQLPVEIMKGYREFERNLIVQMKTGETLEAASIAVLTNKLLQWANGTNYTGEDKQFVEIHSAKLDALEDIINDNAGENIIVVYNYRSDLVRLMRRFPKATVLDKNGIAIDQWNKGEISLLLAHPASAAHGINLQAGGAMIVWYGLNWSLELDQQMNARVHRQGQIKPVRIIRIVAEGTIDIRVLSVLKSKSRIQSDLINSLKQGWKV
jgi:SNF2 family DNA or RNA helicase